MKPKRPIRLNLEAAGRELGVSKETLRRGLIQLGLATTKGKRYDLRTIYRAMTGDGKAERTRLVRAQADREELELATMRRTLAPLSEGLADVTAAFAPTKQALLAMSQEIASRCNPSDPDLARAAIHERVAEILTDAANMLAADEGLPNV